MGSIQHPLKKGIPFIFRGSQGSYIIPPGVMNKIGESRRLRWFVAIMQPPTGGTFWASIYSTLNKAPTRKEIMECKF